MALAAATALVGTGLAPALAAGSPGTEPGTQPLTTTAQNKQEATDVATSVLDALPAYGAVPATGSTAGAAGSEFTTAEQSVTQARVLVRPGTPAAALAAVRADPPAQGLDGGYNAQEITGDFDPAGSAQLTAGLLDFVASPDASSPGQSYLVETVQVGYRDGLLGAPAPQAAAGARHLSQAGGCPTSPPAAVVDPGADLARQFVPAGAISGLACAWYPPYDRSSGVRALVRHHHLDGPTVARLSTALRALPYPLGDAHQVHSCPAGFGEVGVVVLHFHGAPEVDVLADLDACGGVDNGLRDLGDGVPTALRAVIPPRPVR